jgi:hypothetical protein
MTTTEGAAFSKTAAKELLRSRRVDTGAVGWGRTGSEAGAATAVRQNSGISILSFIGSENTIRLDALGKIGEKRHWIYEVHLVDYERKIGAFHEAILTI